jgi:hypothetical protein
LSELTTLTPQLHADCERLVQEKHIVGSRPFQPLRADSAVASFPGSLGGADWGGAAFDPRLGYYIVNTNDLASPEQLVQRPDGSWNLKDGYVYFWDWARRLPCQQPPWGSLYAVDVNTGRIAWRTTLGVTESLPQELRNTGRPSAGGPMTTAGGLTFIGATDDNYFRAFETRTGEEVWTYHLPASIYGTPATYRGKNGKQYVVVVDTGGFAGSPVANDAVLAFALGAQSSVASQPSVDARSPVASQPSAAPRPPATAPLSAPETSPAPAILRDPATPRNPATPPDLVPSFPDTPPALTAPPPGPGLSLIHRSCVSCHDINMIVGKHRAPQDWFAIVARMADRGAEVTPDEMQIIEDYFDTNFAAPADAPTSSAPGSR